MTTLELPVLGMDCAACARKARRALLKVPGVRSADVLLNAEKAIVEADPQLATPDILRSAIEKVGFKAPVAAPTETRPPLGTITDAISRQMFMLLGLLFGVILFIAVIGEGFGLIHAVTDDVPWWVGAAIVLAFGYPVFAEVIRAALRREVTSHALMSLGAVAALIAGQWLTAAVVVFFMRVGEHAERFTSERARQSLKTLSALAPETARVLHNEREQEIPITEVVAGDILIVRPGERVPVDGTVLDGQAIVDQATITGESMPVEVEKGGTVYAATLAQLGYLKLRADHVGRDTTFGRILHLVEEAEAHRGHAQRLADRFSGYYLPVVATIALVTYLVGHNLLAAVAVMVVACSCSFALATPIAVMASVGAAAKRGLLIKGGKYLEALSQADTLLIDKTGTLTTGTPRLTDIVPLDGIAELDLLALAAAAEHHSEHPLAAAVRNAAQARGLVSLAPERFEALPGRGIRATIDGRHVEIGNRRLIPDGMVPTQAAALEAQGKTLLYVAIDGKPAGILAATDTVRPEADEALANICKLGIRHIELLTGDHERTAAAIAAPLGISFRANLLPEDKIRIVRDLQAQGRCVVMIGDGVNDAPALAQADVGIAMGNGTDVAMEAAHIVLMRNDWKLVADAFRIARRTMGVVKTNIAFTALYNIVGLSLAAFGLLPPVYAAALQSLPDIGILTNSSRLIRQR